MSENLKSLLRTAIADEQNAIELYERMLKKATNDEMAVIRDIMNEEKIHFGQLLGLLFKMDPEEAKMYDKGVKENSELKKVACDDMPYGTRIEADGETGENELQKPKVVGTTPGLEMYPIDNGVFNLRAPEVQPHDEQGNLNIYYMIGKLREVKQFNEGTIEKAVDFYDRCLLELAKRDLMEPDSSDSLIEEELEKRKKNKGKLHIQPHENAGITIVDGPNPPPSGQVSSQTPAGGE